VIPGRRCNVKPLIQSGDGPQKSARCYARRGFAVVVRSSSEGQQEVCVHAVRRMMSVCTTRVNVWNVKGEMLPGHARARDDVCVLGQVVKRTRKRYLEGGEQ
jgi:hypothetical protein